MKRIGIPRALFFYEYYPLWKTFFEEVGAEVVVSDRTTKSILNDGTRTCIDEACLPVKVFFGHVANLIGRVDCIFVPRFISISAMEYICPKFAGLPDMIKSSFENLPLIVDTEVNLRKSRYGMYKAAADAGKYFTADKHLIYRAFKKAVHEYRNYKETVKAGILPAGSFCDGNYVVADELNYKGGINKGKIFHGCKDITCSRGDAGEKKMNIAVIGHVYNVYDNYVNMNLIKKLRNENINIITIETTDDEKINKKAKELAKRIFWSFGRKAMGTVLYMLERKNIDGIIYVMSFGCGIDSFVCDLAERYTKRKSSIPFMVLTVDEHTGEAGVNTRIEAFIDMIARRDKSENYISAYGQSVCNSKGTT